MMCQTRRAIQPLNITALGIVLCRCDDDVSGSSVPCRNRSSSVPGSSTKWRSTGTDAVDSRARKRGSADQRRRPRVSAAADVRSAAANWPTVSVGCDHGVRRQSRGIPVYPAHLVLVPKSASVSADCSILRPDNAADDRVDERPAAKHTDPGCTRLS